MWKNCKVFMLPTKERSKLLLNEFNKRLASESNNPLHETTKQWVCQHLYITSDEEIKEGEWCIDIWNGEVIQMDSATKNMLDSGMLHNPHDKIIATTDTSYITDLDKFKACLPSEKVKLHNSLLPQLSQQFIEKYIEEYNKGNVITKVMVEYTDGKLLYNDRICSCGHVLSPMEESPHECCGSYKWEYKSVYDKPTLKINSDNTINIKLIKDSWNREEYIANIKAFAKEFVANTDTAYKQADIDKWIEENI